MKKESCIIKYTIWKRDIAVRVKRVICFTTNHDYIPEPSFSNFPSSQGHTGRAAFLALVITRRIFYGDAVRRRDSYEISLELFRSPNAAPWKFRDSLE